MASISTKKAGFAKPAKKMTEIAGGFFRLPKNFCDAWFTSKWVLFILLLDLNLSIKQIGINGCYKPQSKNISDYNYWHV